MKERIRKELEVLTRLCGISGYEESVAAYVKAELEKLCDSVTVDSSGNVIGVKKGNSDGARLMLIAHMDEIGFIVKNILPSGFLLFDKVGSQSGKVMEGRKVVVDGKYMGVIGIKPGHLTSPEEGRTTKTPKQCYVDVCCNSKEEVLSLGIDIGTPITYQSDFDTMANTDYICTKAIDDRVNLVIMLELLRGLKDGNFPGELIIAASVQEEIGMKGARMITDTIRPDYSIVLDTIPSGDTPDVDTVKDLPIKLGNGPAVPLADGVMSAVMFTLANKKVVQIIKDAAKRANVNLQFITLSGDGYATDSFQVSGSGGGTPCATLTVPRRYTHSPVELLNLNDPVFSVSVLKEIVAANGNVDLSFV